MSPQQKIEVHTMRCAATGHFGSILAFSGIGRSHKEGLTTAVCILKLKEGS